MLLHGVPCPPCAPSNLTFLAKRSALRCMCLLHTSLLCLHYWEAQQVRTEQDCPNLPVSLQVPPPYERARTHTTCAQQGPVTCARASSPRTWQSC